MPRHLLLSKRPPRLLVLALLLIVLLLAGTLLWQQFKRQQGIEHITWHGLSLHYDHLSLEQLSLVVRNAAGTLNASAQGVRLDWHPTRSPRLHRLQINRLEADWQTPPQSAGQSGSGFQLSRPDPRELLPDWLPRAIEVQDFLLTLPCASGRCPLNGALALRHGDTSAAPATLQLTLRHDSRRVDMSAQITGPPEHVELAARGQINQQTRLTLTSVFRERPADRSWSGHLDLIELPEASWLLAWIEQWTGPQPLQAAADLRLKADWDWQLAPGALDTRQLRTLSGHLNLDGNLPMAWPLPDIGQLQGNVAMQLRADEGNWRADQLQADLTLTQPAPTLLADLPPALHPTRVRLQLQQDPANAGLKPSLPLQLQLHSDGALALDVQAQLQVNPSAQDWWLQLGRSRLRASAAQLQWPPFTVRGLDLDLQLAGRIDEHGFALNLDKASRAGIGTLQIDGATEPTRLQGLQLSDAALAISGALPTSAAPAFNIQGPLELRAQQLHHPLLHPLAWSWHGQLQASQERQQLSGTLENSAGFKGPLQINRNAAMLDIHLQQPESFLRSGNPLAASLADWPPLLELRNGRLQLDARLALPATGALSAQVTAHLKGVDGLYDRTEFSGLDAQLGLQLASSQLHLAVADLQLRQANAGIPLGPLRFEGEYHAPLEQLSQGHLAWRTARSGLLGGDVWLEPGSLHLNDENLLSVHIRGLQVQELFRAYPAEGLSGRGVLDGELPLSFGPSGVHIVGGRITARAPGGQLQFNSPRISALGRSNPAMQVVADALADFRYETLDSGVDYDAQGKLRLALRLEGRNPDVERGRPINFNINLEEDIPALLTSLQLTGRVSDRVRERVQQHLQPQPTP